MIENDKVVSLPDYFFVFASAETLSLTGSELFVADTINILLYPALCVP